MDEAFECLTLMQTGKSYVMPIVLIEPKGSDYWLNWDHFVSRHMLGRSMISKEDRNLYLITNSIERACEEIVTFYRVFHSMRYLDGLTILRLNHLIGEDVLNQLNDEFAAILVNGQFHQYSGPLPEERVNPELDNLPRIVFPFNRQNMGRLRQVINRINNHLKT